MFRRWLLSLPAGRETEITAPDSLPGMSDPNWVVLVGKGSLGIDPDNPQPGDQLDKVTRAYLTNIGTTGKHAWWIGPENHKARIDKTKKPPRTPDTAVAWETSQSDTAEVGVSALEGFEALDNNTLGDKLVTTQTLRPADIAEDKVEKHFFDLTAQSQGVLASVRTGHLKKDLSLLFEQDKADLPDPYRFDAGDVREPSIRPMSPEIEGRPVLKDSSAKATRHFASWTRMRHFYRIYRQDSDALAPTSVVPSPSGVGTNGSPGLVWDGGKPVADCNVSCYQQPNQSTPIIPAWAPCKARLIMMTQAPKPAPSTTILNTTPNTCSRIRISGLTHSQRLRRRWVPATSAFLVTSSSRTCSSPSPTPCPCATTPAWHGVAVEGDPAPLLKARLSGQTDGFQ